MNSSQNASVTRRQSKIQENNLCNNNLDWLGICFTIYPYQKYHIYSSFTKDMRRSLVFRVPWEIVSCGWGEPRSNPEGNIKTEGRLCKSSMTRGVKVNKNPELINLFNLVYTELRKVSCSLLVLFCPSTNLANHCIRSKNEISQNQSIKRKVVCPRHYGRVID